LNDVEKLFIETERTMKIFLGIGSLADNSFRGVEYAHNIINFYDDSNYTHFSTAHPQMENIFYLDQEVQPSGNTCVGSILL